MSEKIKYFPKREQSIFSDIHRREGNQAEIINPAGKQTLYYMRSDSNGTPRDLPTNIDSMIIATLGQNWTEGTSIVKGPYNTDDQVGGYQNVALIDFCKEKEIPVIFTDVVYNMDGIRAQNKRRQTIRDVETYGTGVLALSSAATIGLTRRQFLGLVGFAGAVYGGSSVLSNEALRNSTMGTSLDLNKQILKYHPEMYPEELHISNVTMAYKAQYLQEKCGYENMGTVLPTYQVQIENDLLTTTREKLTWLNENVKDIEKVIQPETFSLVEVNKFNKKKDIWVSDRFRIKELDDIVTSLV